MEKEWLFFDLGNVLYDETLADRMRVQKLLSKMNSPLTVDEFYGEMVIAAKEKKASPFTAVREKFAIQQNEPYDSEYEILYQDAKEILKELSKHYKLAILANQPKNKMKRLQDDGLLPFFEICLLSESVGISKPDINFFKLGIEMAHCSAEKIYMIGDRLDNDIYPAKKLGMGTIRVLQGLNKVQEVETEEDKADYEVLQLSDLLSILI